MLYDHRTYTCKPGTIRKALELYAAHGFKAQSRHLGQPVLYAMTEVGNVNQYVHIWAYDSVDDRAKKRAAMQADPEWQHYLNRLRKNSLARRGLTRFNDFGNAPVLERK